MGRACATHTNELPGHAPASTGVTPNMMMLGQQTRLPIQAMYGMPLGLDEEQQTMSVYVAALQDGLREAYRHAREGLQRAALHQRHYYDANVQRQEYQAGELVWVHNITLGRNQGRNYNSHGMARCLSPRSSIEAEWSYAGSRTNRSP